MVRRSRLSNRAQLSATQLETRDVPAGMIDVSISVGSGQSYLYILGDNNDNHVRVETPNIGQIVVSSDSGQIRYYDSLSNQYVVTTDPIVITDWVYFFGQLNCQIQTGNGNDVVEATGDNFYSLQIATDNGDDQVLVDVGGFQLPGLSINTGAGADRVTLRDCGGIDQYMAAVVTTGQGDDRVILSGSNTFGGLYIRLDGGNDVLEGDSMPGVSLTTEQLTVLGNEGHDQILNADYFTLTDPWNLYIDGIEEIN